MPRTKFRPTPCVDLPFLNAWRDKMIETAYQMNILIPERRELIDFEELFKTIQNNWRIAAKMKKEAEEAAIIKTQAMFKTQTMIKRIDENIESVKYYSNIVEGLSKLKKLLVRKLK